MSFFVKCCYKYRFSLPPCIQVNSGSQKILGAKIDRKLNFNETAKFNQIACLSDKASRKIQALARVYPYTLQTKNNFWLIPILCLKLVTVL